MPSTNNATKGGVPRTSGGKGGSNLELQQDYEGRKFMTVKTLSSGQYFGEYSCLTGAPRSATVVATTYCELLALAKVDMQVGRKDIGYVCAVIDIWCLWLLPSCSYLVVRALLSVPCYSYLIVCTLLFVPFCSYLIASILFVPSSYLIVCTLVFVPGYSYLCCSYLFYILLFLP